MKIYDEGSEQLQDLIKSASSDGATLLVPDLQRPYVWKPSHVILLVDSLLRGWPFGTLLLWKVHNEELAGIPSRPFWRVADKTREFDDMQASKRNPPAEFRMVLDGQQRLQSLLLAFGSDSYGFRLPDYEWSIDLDAESPRGKNAKNHWSLGHLCLDVSLFGEQVKAVGDLAGIDFRRVLCWAVQSPGDGRSALKRPTNYKYPIASALEPENKGRFVRLSRFWELASTQAGLGEKHFREKLKPLLDQHGVAAEMVDQVLGTLAELMVRLAGIKLSKVSFLQLAPFNEGNFSREIYNDAIVNIFTRLNSAGRVLTRQEITFAWIKTGWDAGQIENRTAGQCFDELHKALDEKGVTIDLDDLVGAVSAMWSVLYRGGALLNANDLLSGEKVRPMAQDLVQNWKTVSDNAIEGVRLVCQRELHFGTHYRSVNVLTLLLTWRLLGRKWLAAHSLSVTEKDRFEKLLDAAFTTYCDRWILMSQWSGRWGKSTDKIFADYVKALSIDWAKISLLVEPGEVIETLKSRLNSWIESLQAESAKYIDDLKAEARERVHIYYLPLWVWHRLDRQRWEASEVSLRETKRGNSKLEVDHIVAVKLWEKLPGLQLPLDSEDDGATDAIDMAMPVNAFGNCFLLKKSFNIAKGAEPLEAFLNKVYEFTERKLDIDEWTKNLGVHTTLKNPTGKSSSEVSTIIEARTVAMKAELKEYLAGTRQRVDV